MNKKYILGGGVSGLIFKFYNPEFTIISPDVGGSLVHNNVFSVSWIHDTKYTRKLLSDLKIVIDPYDVVMGYYYNGYVHSGCPDEYKRKIILNKMTDITNDKLIENFEIPATILSVDSNIIKGLNLDIFTIFDKLDAGDDMITATVKSITDTHITISTGEKLQYDKLVSTIPAPVFWKIYSDKNNQRGNSEFEQFKFLPITIVDTFDKPLIFNAKYKLIYFAEDYSFNRILWKEPFSYSYEFTGKIDNIKKYLPNVKITSISKQHVGRLITCDNVQPSDNITFLGRFAEWDHSNKIQHVAAKAIKFNN